MPRSWSEAVKACRKHPKRANGRWCSCKVGWRYRLGVPDPVTEIVGAPKWSATFPTKDLADADQRKVRQGISEGTFTADRGQTVAEFLRSWVARKLAAGRKVSTVTGYEKLINAHLIPHLGKHRLGALRPDHVQAMLDRIAAAPSTGRSKQGTPVTAGTLTNIRACLRAALNDAVRQGLISRNVATLVTLPSVRRPEPVAVPSNRLGLFLHQVEGDRLEAMWLVDAVYGMRRGELLGIGWDNIDMDAELIRVRRTLVEVKGDHLCRYCGQTHHRLLWETVKTRSGERTYPLVPEVIAALQVHKLAQEAERAAYGAGYCDHGAVFCEPDGSPLRPSKVSAWFKGHVIASGAAAGMDKVPSLKALRSSAVTALHEAGMAIETIAKIMGHASTDPTIEHYLAVNAERAREGFEVIATRLVSRRTDRLTDQQRKTASRKIPPSEGGGTAF
jgi:integrase